MGSGCSAFCDKGMEVLIADRFIAGISCNSSFHTPHLKTAPVRKASA